MQEERRTAVTTTPETTNKNVQRTRNRVLYKPTHIPSQASLARSLDHVEVQSCHLPLLLGRTASLHLQRGKRERANESPVYVAPPGPQICPLAC